MASGRLARRAAGQVQALTKAPDLSEQAYRAGSITLTNVLDIDARMLAHKKVRTSIACQHELRELRHHWRKSKKVRT
jgi:hypothetical protein